MKNILFFSFAAKEIVDAEGFKVPQIEFLLSNN